MSAKTDIFKPHEKKMCSVRGAKAEDTFVVGENGTLENLTRVPAWPSVDVQGRARRLPLDRA